MIVLAYFAVKNFHILLKDKYLRHLKLKLIRKVNERLRIQNLHQPYKL
jgi:hypothetical protein